MSSGPQRRGSSRLERRKSSGPYSRSGSTGLTSYLQGSVSFSDEAAAMEADDAVGELKPARAKGSLASKALSAISFGRGSKAPAPAPTLASSSLRVGGVTQAALQALPAVPQATLQAMVFFDGVERIPAHGTGPCNRSVVMTC